MFNREGKQYIWPFVVLALVVISFIPWILDVCSVAAIQDITASNEVAKYFLLTWFPTLGNVLIVALLLIWFGAPMISEMLVERKQTIERDIDEAARAKKQAEVEYDDAETKLNNLDAEVKEMRASYKRAIEEERQNISADTQKQQERLKKDADVIFQLQSGVATRTFEREIMTKALDQAREEIITRVANDSALRDRLIDQGIASLNLN